MVMMTVMTMARRMVPRAAPPLLAMSLVAGCYSGLEPSTDDASVLRIRAAFPSGEEATLAVAGGAGVEMADLKAALADWAGAQPQEGDRIASAVFESDEIRVADLVDVVEGPTDDFGGAPPGEVDEAALDVEISVPFSPFAENTLMISHLSASDLRDDLRRAVAPVGFNVEVESADTAWRADSTCSATSTKNCSTSGSGCIVTHNLSCSCPTGWAHAKVYDYHAKHGLIFKKCGQSHSISAVLSCPPPPSGDSGDESG